MALSIDSLKKGVHDEIRGIPGVLRRANPGLYKLVLITDDLEEPVCLVRIEVNAEHLGHGLQAGCVQGPQPD